MIKNFFLLACLLLPFSVSSNEKHFCSCQESSISAYKIYCFLKFILYSYLILPLWADFDFIESVGICCNKCNEIQKSGEFGTVLSFLEEPIKFDMLKVYWQIKDRSDVEDFMCYCYEKLQQKCFSCGDFYGWHPVHSE